MNLLANSDIRNYNTRISVVTLDKVKRTGIKYGGLQFQF